MRLYHVFVLCMLFCTGVVSAGKNIMPWRLEVKEDRYEVYSREVPDTDIREVRATAYMTGTVKEALDILLFSRRDHSRIFENITVSEVLSCTDRCDVSYNVVSIPLLSDRDYIIRTCITDRNDKSVTITWEDMFHGEKPACEEMVRVRDTRGHWKITHVGKDEIRADYYIFVDAGGSIPAFVQNIANRKAVPDMLFSIYREIIRRRKKQKDSTKRVSTGGDGTS